jgi:hypothetical protein
MGTNGLEIDMTRRLSGHPSDVPLEKLSREQLKSYRSYDSTVTAFVGPWGASFSANITSDDTGIGSWTEAQFLKAIRQGKSKGLDGGRTLLPPMPWVHFAKLRDQDLKAIFAFLKSTDPVVNRVPQPISPNDLPTY